MTNENQSQQEIDQLKQKIEVEELKQRLSELEGKNEATQEPPPKEPKKGFVFCANCRHEYKAGKSKCPNCKAKTPSSPAVKIISIIIFILICFGLYKCVMGVSNTMEETKQASMPKVLTEEERAALRPTLFESMDKVLGENLKTFRFNADAKTEEDIFIEITKFEIGTQLIENAQWYQDLSEAEKATLSKFKNKLASVQAEEFPKIRKAFGKILNEKLWIDNGKATVSGATNAIITLYHRDYILNRKKDEAYKIIHPVLLKLRFKIVKFFPYEGATEGASANLEELSDKALLIWNGPKYSEIK